MRITKKKLVGVVAVSAVVAMGAGSAFAFWTTGGGGTGTADVGTSQDFVITGDIGPDLLLDVEQTFDITVTNPATFPQRLANLSFTIDPVDPGCDADWFILTQPDVTPDVDIAGGAFAVYGAAIQLDNLTAVNQDACKDSDINIAYTSS